MKRALRALADAIAYFTILPLPSSAGRPDGYAIAFLPLCGAAIGALAGAFAWFVSWRMPGWGGLAGLTASIVLTGAVHVDGFLDCCDALAASVPPARRLEILRDPHHGTFAIVGIVLAVLIWWRALDAVPIVQFPLALAFAGVVSRIGAVSNAWTSQYARADGFAPSFAVRPPIWPVALAVALAVALGWFLGPVTIALVPLAVIAGLLLGWVAARRLGGGITGDVYGAIVVVLEIAVLLRLPELEVLWPH